MTTGQMNRRPTFQNGTYTIDAGGGSTWVAQDQWLAWAEIIDTNSSAFQSQSQWMVGADYKVTARFDGRIGSNTRMVYEGQICKQSGSPNVLTEGYKNFLVMRFTRTETYVDIS